MALSGSIVTLCRITPLLKYTPTDKSMLSMCFTTELHTQPRMRYFVLDYIQGNSCLWRLDHGAAQRCFYLVMHLVKIIFSWMFLFSLVLMFGFQSYWSVPLLSFRLSWLYLRVCLEVLAQEHSHSWPNTDPLHGRSFSDGEHSSELWG